MNRWLLLSFALIGVFALGDRPDAQGPTAALHAVGDLAGGGFTTVIRDATRVGGTVYAVGGAVARRVCANAGPCDTTDTPILWQSDGPGGWLTVLPDLNANTAVNNLTAFDITSDAAYIASQARRTNPANPSTLVNTAVRVTRSPLSTLVLDPALDLRSAAAISDDGSVLYGGDGVNRAFRYEAGVVTQIPLLLQGHIATFITPRGISSSGHVAVGASAGGGLPTRAFRYEHGVGVAAIPLLPGGTNNSTQGVTADGDLVLVAGDSDRYVSEPYLWRASTGEIQRLGVPNEPWLPGGRLCAIDICLPLPPGRIALSGVTADGLVVVMTFVGDDGQYGYIHNSHGWFHLTSVLGSLGVDITADGWNPHTILTTGVSADGTLVFGSGERNGRVHGFVAEFPPGALASFNPQPTPPASTALVGAWVFGDAQELADPGALANPELVVVFTDEGVYYHAEGEFGEPGAGFERGFYSFDGNQLKLTTLFDSNGASGLSDTNGSAIEVGVADDTLMAEGQIAARRITGGPNSIVGAWVGGAPTEQHNSFMIAFAEQGYFAIYDFADGHDSEKGTYTWNPVTHELIATVGGNVNPGNFVTLSSDALGLNVEEEGEDPFDLTRVIDPAIVPVITNADLSADGTVGQAFGYGVTATNTVSYSAMGLPSGLTIGPVSGDISGTPTVGGQFAVSVKATNYLGVSDFATLTLTVAIPTPVGQNVVVQPEVPQGQGPVTVSFSEVTVPGTTTVEVVDLEDLGVPPPGSVQIAGVIYNVETTAQFAGLITLCFSYAGIDFGGATPRLFHYETNVWVDITTGVDPATQTICGATTSLSPFAVLASHVVRTGFYAPVNPIAGYLNTVNGGATVPLKFNVSVNGVNQTTTAGIAMTVQTMTTCDASAPEDPIEPATTTGGTSLRYDAGAGHFVQNWRVPRTPGQCYMIRMTTEADGLALTARFKVR